MLTFGSGGVGQLENEWKWQPQDGNRGEGLAGQNDLEERREMHRKNLNIDGYKLPWTTSNTSASKT